VGDESVHFVFDCKQKNEHIFPFFVVSVVSFVDGGVCMNRAYRFRIYPTSEQETMIRKTFGCVRLFNQMLAERKIAYERDSVETGQPKQR